MASQNPPTDEAGDQLPLEAAPAYNDVTGTLDLNAAGLSTQSQVGSQFYPLSRITWYSREIR